MPDAGDAARYLQRNAQGAECNRQLLRVLHIPFLGLTGTALMIVPVIRTRLLAAGEKAGVCVLLSNPDGRRCAGPEGVTLRHAGTSVLIQDATSDE